jgi:hypothetical protein
MWPRLKRFLAALHEFIRKPLIPPKPVNPTRGILESARKFLDNLEDENITWVSIIIGREDDTVKTILTPKDPDAL